MKCILTTSKSVMACFNYKLKSFGSHADTVSKWNLISTQKLLNLMAYKTLQGEGRGLTYELMEGIQIPLNHESP